MQKSIHLPNIYSVPSVCAALGIKQQTRQKWPIPSMSRHPGRKDRYTSECQQIIFKGCGKRDWNEDSTAEKTTWVKGKGPHWAMDDKCSCYFHNSKNNMWH
jgi:hypothetical protein